MKKTILSTFVMGMLISASQVFGMQNGGVDSVYVVGSATAGGWDLGSQTMMTQSETDTSVFVFSDTLKVGEFKIKLYPEQDFCAGDWLHPLAADQDLSLTSAAILAGCSDDNPDYKWVIAEPGIYTINADLSDTTVTITLDQSLEISYESIFLVGSATPGGWSLAEQTPMIKDDENGNLFTWDGKLAAGEFKIKTYAADDFCAGEWIHPLTQDASPVNGDFEILIGCADGNPDYKWKVEEADTGMYTIAVDISSTSIEFEKAASTSSETDNTIKGFSLGQNYPNPFNPSTSINFSIPNSGQVSLSVYNVLGREAATLIDGVQAAGTHTVEFNANTLPTGIYYYKLQTEAGVIVKSMSLIK